MENEQTNQPIDTSNDGQVQDGTVGIIAYITLIGFIIAIVLNNDKSGADKKFGAFHLRQSLGLIIFTVGLYIVLMILSAILISISWRMLSVVSLMSMILWLGILALVILGIVNAANKQEKELPLIGGMTSKMLGKTFE